MWNKALESMRSYKMKMFDFETLSKKVKAFCAAYEKIYVYSRGYTGIHTQDFLKKNEIKINGIVSKEEGGFVALFQLNQLIRCFLISGNVALLSLFGRMKK